MTIDNTRGFRLLVSLVDEYAETDRVWAAVPNDESDLSKGFKDITYKHFAEAVDRAVAWLQSNLYKSQFPFETIAYAGPKNVSFSIVAVAAAKIMRKLLLPSPHASIAAQAHLLDDSKCGAFLCTGFFKDSVEKIISLSDRKPKLLQVPELSEWLEGPKAPRVLFGKSWNEAKSDPWLVLHTSGTTGRPKLITYTHQMMASIDVSELMADADEENFNRHFENRRVYTPLPTLHIIGMTISLQFTVFLGCILVVGPANPGGTPTSVAREMLQYGGIQTALLPPALIDSLSSDPKGLKLLSNLEHLYFGGAPLLPKTANKLIRNGVIPKVIMGSTEACAYFLRYTGPEDSWEYYSFRPGMGMELVPISSTGLYEAVFVRQSGLEKWQQVFILYPDLQRFPTKDLFSKHPSKEGLWKYVGRTDDMIAFSHGEDLYAASVEGKISEHPQVLGVLVGGQSRAKPFAIVEWQGDSEDASDADRLESLRPVLYLANQKVSNLVRLNEELVLFLAPDKKLVRTVKGSVSRQESEELYKQEIDRLYANL